MNRSEDCRDAGLQGGFNVSTTDGSFLSHHTMCKREEEVQHAATIITTHKRPRPGRRRLSTHYLPLSLAQIFFFMIMIMSLLCMPIEAIEHLESQSRAVQGHFLDGRIIFDHNDAPQPALHRRDDPASTDTASTTTAPEAAATSSSSDSSTTTTSLPRAFDGGFGTNFTQPSCPTFLRSMVNNDTFISCVPFSLLLQVRTTSLHPNSPFEKPPRKTNLPLPRIPCPFSTPPVPFPPSPPSSTPPAPSPSRPAQPSCPPSPSPCAPPPPAKTTTTAKTRRCAKPTPASSPTTSPATAPA